MVFCNIRVDDEKILECNVTILILIDGFLQSKKVLVNTDVIDVTILILIDGFLQ